MDILIVLLNKLFVLVFFLAILNTMRHVYYLINTSLASTPEEPKKYTLSNKSLILLGFSISYILSVIITGIQI